MDPEAKRKFLLDRAETMARKMLAYSDAPSYANVFETVTEVGRGLGVEDRAHLAKTLAMEYGSRIHILHNDLFPHSFPHWWITNL